MESTWKAVLPLNIGRTAFVILAQAGIQPPQPFIAVARLKE